MHERPELPEGFQGQVYKDRMSGVGGVVGYMISLWTFFQLVGGEVIGNQQHQPSSSNWSVSYVLVGTYG